MNSMRMFYCVCSLACMAHWLLFFFEQVKMCNLEWEADRKTLLKLYRSLIRSKLDYGNFIYQSARKIYLKILNLIYHGGLRLVLGSFKTSPVESLYAEANQAWANIRSNKLALQFYVKLKLCPSNPAYDGAFHPK